MSLDYRIRTLVNDDMPAMHIAFQKAFSDYKVSFKMDYATFSRRFKYKLNIQFDLSVGIFHRQEMVAFIFHALNQYHGELTLYNGGTGVIPAHRGKQLVQSMYDFILPIAQQNKVTSNVLEVLTDNHRAIKAYEKVGFKKVQTFRCFKSSHLHFKHINKEVVVKNQRLFDPAKYQYFMLNTPSFQDSNEHLIYNADHETTLEAMDNKEIVGYIIFQKTTGRISQLAVKEDRQHEGIGSRLITECKLLSSEAPSLTLINLPAKAEKTYHYLLNRGFENQIDQYEMKLSL